DDSGKCELRVLAFSTEPFEDDLVVNYDTSSISMTSKCVLAETWDSVYCREWNVSIKKLTKFKDDASLLTCKGNGSECTIQVRDTFKAFDVSSENVFMKRDSTKYPVVITVTPINVEVLGEVRYNTEWLEIHRVDNLDGTTDLQITPKHFGTQFHTHIELFQPFSEISDGTITLSCL
ncbi:MAG: hypothetical protein Q8M16_20845, partial [Pirellulaceae bacterium]|nr:hypothetical protein [Pirellulaceae bacterium]